MGTVLGLIGLVAFVIGVVALAAAVTFAVIKISPARDTPKGKPAAEPDADAG